MQMYLTDQQWIPGVPRHTCCWSSFRLNRKRPGFWATQNLQEQHLCFQHAGSADSRPTDLYQNGNELISDCTTTLQPCFSIGASLGIIHKLFSQGIRSQKLYNVKKREHVSSGDIADLRLILKYTKTTVQHQSKLVQQQCSILVTKTVFQLLPFFLLLFL